MYIIQEGQEGGHMKVWLFDLDGTLIDSAALSDAAYDATLAEIGVSPMRSHFWRQFDGVRSSEVFSMLMRDRVLPDSLTVGALVKARRCLVEQLWSKYPVVAIPGAVDFVRDVHRSGAMLGLVTSSSYAFAVNALDSIEIASIFRVYVCGDTQRGGYANVFVRSKPHPEPYQKALMLAGRRMSEKVDPKNVVVVEDSPNGIMSASGAGCGTVVGLAFRGSPGSLRRAGASIVVKSYTDEAIRALIR